MSSIKMKSNVNLPSQVIWVVGSMATNNCIFNKHTIYTIVHKNYVQTKHQHADIAWDAISDVEFLTQ